MPTTFPPARPASVTTAAVVGIIFSSLGLLCGVIGLAAEALQVAASGRTDQPHLPGWMMAILATATVLSMILSVAWLIASIQLLKLAPWARSFVLKLAPLQIVILVLTLGMNLILIVPEQKNLVEAQLQKQQQQSGQALPAAAVQFARSAVYIGPVIGFAFGMILPVTMLIALSASAAKAAFRETPAAP